MADLRVARSELILGSPQSGKTARAESLAAVWLAQSEGHRAVFIATAQAWDEEMRRRIAQHQRRRSERVPRMATVEEPLELAHAIGRYSRPDTLIVADCLTLWLTARLMPAAGPHPGPPPVGEGKEEFPGLEGEGKKEFPGREEEGKENSLPQAKAIEDSLSLWERAGVRALGSTIAGALRACAGPIVLISNEPSLPTIPSGDNMRAFFEALGGLNQEAAAACERVTLMSAGQALTLKDAA
jgi:adenosylcobinamide kinase / adenosylcobinamide-phosphate guanylyltransferase